MKLKKKNKQKSAPSSPDSAVSSPRPYVHPTVLLHEQDIDYPEEMSEEDRIKERRRLGKLACVNLSSTATDEEIGWVMEFYYQEGLWARPRPEMRSHIFNFGEFKTPRIVLTPLLVKLGVGAPLHPFF